MIGQGAVPQLLRQSALYGDALYRVVNVAGELVEVEVVSAPGLKPGTRMRVTQAAIAAMSVVPESSWQHARTLAGVTDKPASPRLSRVSVARRGRS